MGIPRPPSRLFLLGWAAALVVACGLGTGGVQSSASPGSHDGGGPSADGASDEATGDEGAADDVLTQDDAPSSSSGAGSSSGAAGSGSSSSGSSGAEASTDAPTDQSSPAGDGGPTPGSVACAGTACSLSSSICCICPGCFPPFPTSCFPSFPGCVTGVPLHCDDRSDCASGQVCCGSYSGTTFSGSSCKTKCASSDVQLCNVDGECAQGTCGASTALTGLSICM